MTQPIRILVVDDDFATRLLACEALEAEGFATDEAETGDDAIEKVEAAAPDAVLLDVNMPGIDGYEVCRRLRARPDGADLSIMVMTATDDRDAVERAFAAGATDFMTKPLNLPLLGHRMRFMQRAADATAAAREAANKAKRDELEILQLAYYDEVTGIPNTRFVEQYVASADASADANASLIAITIDLGIAEIPRLTQGTRDALVRAATSRVFDTVCANDRELHLDQLPCAPGGFGGHTFVARTGPDELTVVSIAHAAPAATAREIATAISVPFSFDGRSVTLRPRIGVTAYPEATAATREVYVDAVYALQQALRVAPRDIVMFGAVLRDRRWHHENVARRLSRALDEDNTDMIASYAPRRDGGGRLIGVRITPQFVPLEDDRATLATILAANPQLPHRLSAWALQCACRDAGTWLRAGTALRVAIEVPAAMLLEPGFVPQLGAAIDDAGATPYLFDLELVHPPSTDADMARLAQIIATLRERGMRITLARLDGDFPLRNLTCLAVDGVRIDQGVIEHRGSRFLSTAFAMAKSLELRVAIAGIDALASLRGLIGFDVDEIAGSEVGEAMTADRVPHLTAALDRRPVVQRGGWDTLSPTFTID